MIRAYRPLSEAEVKELDAYYRIGMTYSSNALEGNSLTLSETKVLLEDGITGGVRKRQALLGEASPASLPVQSQMLPCTQGLPPQRVVHTQFL